MHSKKRLNSSERQFFSLVNKAVMANPFSQERIDADMAISGLFPGISRAMLLEKTIEEVNKRVSNFDASGNANYKSFSGKDSELVRNTLLFHCYHRYCLHFDELIEKQIAAGEKPLKVSFASEAMSYFTRIGFDRSDFLHYFSLFYQMRRAFYFIDKSLVGNSPCMIDLRESLWNNIFTHSIDLYNRHLWNRMEDFSTLILGETGTGKGTAAAAIGSAGFIPFNPESQRFEESFTRSFTSLNLSQYSEALIESELFGHKKGAFTGAVNDHKGIFSFCSPHGAIFLDEIGEVTTPLQIKLLNVLEERIFSPVGSHEQLRFEGRIIAATNRSLDSITRGEVLRKDFYYRLCADTIQVPPLRQRIQENPAELDDLIRFFLNKIIGDESPAIAKHVIKTVKSSVGRRYGWPGNVRELSQCIRRVLLNNHYMPNQPSIEKEPFALNRLIESGPIDAAGLLKGYCKLLYEKFGTYGEVARITKLDRRTVKKHIIG